MADILFSSFRGTHKVIILHCYLKAEIFLSTSYFIDATQHNEFDTCYWGHDNVSIINFVHNI